MKKPFLIICMTVALGHVEQLNAEILNLELESPYSKTFDGGSWIYTAQGTNSTNITIQSDEKIVVRQHHVRHGYNNSGINSETTFQVRYGNSSNTVTIYRNSGTGTQTNTSGILGQTIYGPCVITIDARLTGGGAVYTPNSSFEFSLISLFTLEKEKLEEADSLGASANSVPVTAVVVPANASGDVDVLLEQSTDMITWTQCLPGTYNAATQKRFFRVRAVEK